MKTKPILTAIVTGLLICGAMLFSECKNTDAKDKDAVKVYINNFAGQLEKGNKDSLAIYFLNLKKPQFIERLTTIVANKASYNGTDEALLKVTLDKAHIIITAAGTDTYSVSIPVSISGGGTPVKTTILLLSVQKNADNAFIITELNAQQFFSLCLEQEKGLKYKNVPDSERFQPITIAAFKTAEKLKARYDSVLFFDHIDNHTWFYVINGKWNEGFYWDIPEGKPPVITYKMGLVNPDLKEVIPAKYDLIHNVNGTINGLIEVEKNDKKGFYDLNGNNVVAVEYDEAYPLKDDNTNLAVLRKDDDYFYLKKDLTISDKQAGFKIADILPQIKRYTGNYTLSDSTSKDLMECNDRGSGASIVIPPSYLVNWNVLPKFVMLANPFRISPDAGDEGTNAYYKVKFTGSKPDEENWLQTAYYSIVSDYLGSRGGLYASNTVVIVNKKSNRVYGKGFGIYHGLGEGGGSLSGKCNDQFVRAIGDTLYEFKATANIDQSLINGQIISEAPYYHYLHVVNGKLTALPENRLFAFTQYVKMDDSYLSGCFVIDEKGTDRMNADVLQYLKNEIYASYNYQFKNPKWTEVFSGRFNQYDSRKTNPNVNDSLTTIDKYNINFINQKLKSAQGQKPAVK